MTAEERIKSTFCELLERKPYSEITIGELCRTAHVSSKTFYKHYDGKPDLVRAIMYDDWVNPVLQVREVLPLDSIRSSSHLMIEQSFERIYQRRSIYLNLFKHYGRAQLNDDIGRLLAPLNRQIYSRYGLPEKENEFVVALFSTFQIPVIHWWLTERDDISPKHMARYFYDWCFGHWKDVEP